MRHLRRPQRPEAEEGPGAKGAGIDEAGKGAAEEREGELVERLPKRRRDR